MAELLTQVPGDAPARKRMSPRKRALCFRLVQYAVLLAVVVLAVININGRQIQRVFFRLDLIDETVGVHLLTALKNTLAYTAGSFVLGLLLGTVLALMRLSQVRPYRWLATVYVEFFRGVPALVVLLAFSMLPMAFKGMKIPFEPYGAVWTALGMVVGAYMSETIRAGIQAVPKGQVEAARSLGMRSGMAMRKIVLPQAFRIVIPPLTNELIILTKDSSLVYVLGLTVSGFDLTKYGRDLSFKSANLTPLVTAGLCYLVITLPLTYLVRRLEARAKKER
ncbi:MAG: amino acid ABC transporter permease [Propionibacteriaceae bacterium]|jgi:polar amino acid transport system permease protein|nr:amino acid ABC transporter permease [Propionibacteriaceae bacterium]